MKIYIIIAALFYLIMGYTANFFLFKFTTLPFIGFMLLGLIVIGIATTIIGKTNRKRKGIQGEPDAFIFPDKAAKKMKKIDLGTQYEASVLSTTLLMIGIVVFLIYFVFFTSSSWMMKGLVIFNSICGLGLMGGMLVTYYQQLISYRESTKFLNTFATKQNQSNRLLSKQEPVQPEELYDEYDDEYGEEEYYDEPSYDYRNERRTTR
jgi:hypothetical protein